MKEVDNYYDQWSNCPSTDLESSANPTKRARAMTRIQQALIAAQELGDEKLRVVAQLQEVIDQKTRQLDTDYKNLEYADKDDPGLRESPSNETSPSSPSAYVSSMSSANQKLDDSRGLGDLPVSHEPKSSCSKAGGSGSSGSSGNGASSISGGLGSSNTHASDKASAWKRSRRAREAVSRSSGSGNAFASTSKAQSDVDTMGSVSQSKAVASTSSQHSSAVGSSNINRNKGNNNGNKNQSKKRKRTSGRTNNGSNGRHFL